MYKIRGASHVTPAYVDLSFRHTQLWPAQVLGMANTVLLIGDDGCGPAMALTALSPGEASELSSAHQHGADNFRISLRGEFVMGREMYGPGEFRFQRGWRTYPSDNNSNGSDGGWEFIIMADRRGFRRREVPGWDSASPEGQAEIALQHYIARTFEFDGDLVDADGSVAPGPSALAVTLGPTSNSGQLSGSFSDRDQWRLVGPATQTVVSLMGDATRGPVLVLAATGPDGIAMGPCCFDTEVLRIVVSGSCAVDGRAYETGDMRLQLPGMSCGPVLAGGDGLHEVLVFGDRRGVRRAIADDSWPAQLGDIVDELLAGLQSPTRQSA